MAEVKTKASHIKEANENLQYVPSEKEAQPQKLKTTKEEIEERFRNGGMAFWEYSAAMERLDKADLSKDADYKVFDAAVAEELESKKK